MTREQWKEHKKAIIWFLEQPEGTEIWCRGKADDTEWILVDNPSWSTENIYVINDKFSEIRKAIADGKQIQIRKFQTWDDLDVKDPNFEPELSINCYRIKPEIKFPIFKKNDFMVVRFENDKKYRIEFIFNYNKFYDFMEKTKEYPEPELLYFVDNDMSSFIQLDDEQWKDVLYDKERELWDGQPVFVWDNDWDIGRNVEFYDAENECSFTSSPYIEGIKYDNYEPYPHLTDEWLIKQYNKLYFDD